MAWSQWKSNTPSAQETASCVVKAPSKWPRARKSQARSLVTVIIGHSRCWFWNFVGRGSRRQESRARGCWQPGMFRCVCPQHCYPMKKYWKSDFLAYCGYELMFLTIAKSVWAFRFEVETGANKTKMPVDNDSVTRYHQGFLYCPKTYGCKPVVRSGGIRETVPRDSREYNDKERNLQSVYRRLNSLKRG